MTEQPEDQAGVDRRDSKQPGGQSLSETAYRELRRLAGRFVRREGRRATLEPTSLVHEAWLRMRGAPNAKGMSRSHFLATAAHVMRRVLVDHARRRRALKRRAGRAPVSVSALVLGRDPEEVDLLDLEEALVRLTGHDPRAARVVELRFFGGLTVDEAATVLQVSRSTAEADWRHARAWLRRTLRASGTGPP